MNRKILFQTEFEDSYQLRTQNQVTVGSRALGIRKFYRHGIDIWEFTVFQVADHRFTWGDKIRKCPLHAHHQTGHLRNCH